MLQSRRRWRNALGAVLLGLLAVVLLVRTEQAGEWICGQLRARLPAALDARVGLGKCAVDPLSASVEIRDVEVTPLGAERPLVRAELARVGLRGLFPGGIALQDVEVVKPEVELSLEGQAPARSGECPLVALEGVRIGRLRVAEGRVRLRLAPDQLVTLDGVTVDASLSRRDAQLVLDARGGVVEAAGRTLRLGRLALEGALEPGAAEAEVQRLEASVEGISVSISGRLQSLCEPVPSASLTAQLYLGLEALPRLGLDLPAPSGQVLARASVSGRLDAPSVRAQLQGSKVALGPYQPGDFSAQVSWSGKTVRLEEFLTRAGDGEARVSGELSLTQGFPVSVKVETKEISFARVLGRAGIRGAWVEFPATVKASLGGTLSPSPELVGDAEFRAGAFTLAARAFDAPKTAGRDILAFSQASGRFRVSITPRAVTFDDVAVRVGPRDATRVQGRVKLMPEETLRLDIEAQAEAIDLSDFGSIAELPWAGFGQARMSVQGPVTGITVEGQTTLRDFKLRGYSLGVVQSPLRYQADVLSFPSISAQKGQTQYFGEVALRFLDEGVHARATVQLPDGRVEDVVDLLADLSPVMENLQQGVLTGRISALAAVDSPVAALDGVIAARVRDVRYYERRLGQAAFVTRFEQGEALVLEPMVFDGPLGRLAVDGRWDFAGPLDYRLALEKGSLAELIDPDGASGIPAGGTFVAKGTVGGDTDVIRASGWMSSSDVTWKQRVLGPMHLESTLVGRQVEASGTVFPGVQATLSLLARNEWAFRSHLDVALADLSAFLPESAASLAVRLKGAADVNGPMKELGAVHARAVLEQLAISRGDVSAANVEPVEVAWRAGAIEVSSLTLKGPTTELAAAGNWGPVAVDLKTRGSVDLRLLSSFTTLVERTQGRLDFTAAFSGPVKAPTLAGSADLTDARFAVRGQDLAVRGLSGRADFSESRILVQDMQGFVNDGRLKVRGDVRLADLGVKQVELQADVEDVTLFAQPEVPVTLTGALLLASRDAARFQLSGGLDVVKFRYAQPLALDTLLASARSPAATSDSKPTEWLRFDVDFQTAGDVRIENNLARAKLQGRLNLSGTNVKPVLTGVIETAEGAQAYFRNNTFNVQRGQLQFNGLWPTFDLVAQSQVREYLVTVKAFGRLEDPRVSLSSEPSLPDTDLVSLLTLGVTSHERLTETSGAGLAAEALFSVSGLDQQVQRFLSNKNVIGLKDQQVRLTTSFNEATGTAEPAVTWESKLLTDNLKVGITQTATGKGTRAQAEYRFNQRVSARAQWDNMNQNTSVGNPGVEVRFRFEWE